MRSIPETRGNSPQFREEVVDAPGIKNSICVHANNRVEVVDTAVVENKGGHLSKKLVGKDRLWPFVAKIELVCCAKD